MSTGTDYRLSLSVTSSDGRVYRWGPDEPNGQDVPNDLEFSTKIPGGFGDLSCSLLRNINRENPDNVLFDDVRCYGPGNESAWEGRFAQFPRQTSQGFTVNPGAVGYVAHLNDDPSFRMVYRDVDLSRWGPPSTARKLLLTSNSVKDPQTTTDASGSPSVECRYEAPWGAAPALPDAEAWYDAGGGLRIGSVYYEWTKHPNVDNTDVSYAWAVKLGADDSSAPSETSGNLRAAGPGTGTLTASATDRRYAVVQFENTAANAAGLASKQFSIFWRALAVYGNHGLVPRGTEPNGGLYASDVIANILTRAAPLLTYTTGVGGSIEPTTFAIPHLIFPDPTTAADAIAKVSAFGVDGLQLPEWGVYEDRKFFWRSPDPDRLCWQARLSDGAQLTLEGDQADDLYNGVVVSYSDPAGTKKVVGPPAAYWYGGTALADATDTSLVDTSVTNPVNAHGIPRKWARLDLSNPTTQAGAIQLGAVFLAVQSQPQRRGQITLTGTVTHPTINAPQPVWKIRAGDYISVPDSATPNIQRRIIETRYHHETREVVCSIDNTPLTLDGLLEQLQATLVGRIS